MFGLARLTLRRARQERLPQAAGSLTLTTLLSLVPLLAVGFALFRHFPRLAPLESAISDHLLQPLLPGAIAQTVLRHLQRFADNAGHLSAAGTAFLVLTVLMTLLTVENAFNRMWNVRRGRPLHRRLGLYLLVLLLGPPLLGLGLWATVALLSASKEWLAALPVAGRAALEAGPLLLAWAAFAALFRAVPATRVRWRDAIVGGLLAALAIELGKRGFAAWLVRQPTYRTVYGALAVLPVFGLWLYYSWLVTLGAALVTSGLGRGGGASRAAAGA